MLSDWYARYLGRQLDEQSFEVWGRKMLRGDSPREVEAAILGSREYFMRQGGNNVGFVRGIYRDVMGTEPAEPQLAYWLHKLSDLEFRDDFAENFLKTARKNAAFAPPPVVVAPPAPFPGTPPVIYPNPPATIVQPGTIDPRPSYGPGSYYPPSQGTVAPPLADPAQQPPIYIPSSGAPATNPQTRLVPTPLPQLPPPQYQPQTLPLPLPRN
jgi:hypothetical protein